MFPFCYARGAGVFKCRIGASETTNKVERYVFAAHENSSNPGAERSRGQISLREDSWIQIKKMTKPT